MSDDYYYDPTAESGYEPVDTGGDSYDLQGNYDLNPSYDPRANSGLTNYDPTDPYANTPYDPSQGTGQGLSFTYDPDTGERSYYKAKEVPSGYYDPKAFSGIASSSSAAKSSSNPLKKLIDSLGNKESTGRGIMDAMLAMYAIKSMRDQQKVQKEARGSTEKINMALKAVQPTNIPAARAYGEGAKGQAYQATTYAAEGGIMGLAAGGLRDGAFVIPADVVSHFGNGSSEAGLKFLAKKLGATPIKGDGDGMSDSIDTTIEGQQPAKVANEEALVSPEKVAALGNGDPKKGAKALYAMMDRVRKARTGTKKQGKQIKPEKFAPGGIAGYAGGGAVAFADGGTPSAGTSVTSNLSEWAGPYVTNMLSQGQALANQPYQSYTGQLTAGTSPLQQQAFTGYQNLQAPASIGQAAQTAGNVASTAGGMGFTGVQFGNQYSAPAGYQAGQFGNQFAAPAQYQAGQFANQYAAAPGYNAQAATAGFNAPGAYQAGQFANQYTAAPAYSAQAATAGFNAPGAYQGVDFTSGISPQAYQAGQFANQFQGPGAYQTGQISTGLGALGSVQDYINPYTQNVTDIAAREARRQSDITQAAQQAKYAQAGGFGGSRDAIMRAEMARNLGLQIGDIQEKGSQAAYESAVARRMAESQAGVQAQQATEASRQFGAGQAMTAAQQAAQFGTEAQRMTEASRQFGSTQGMQGLQMLLDARKAAEASKQFGSQQAMTGAQLGAQFGLQAQQQSAQERQFAAQQAAEMAQQRAQFGTEAQRMAEASRQFGSTQGLSAAQMGAQLGLQAQQQTAQDRQFAAQQAAEAAQQRAQFGTEAQRMAEASRQFGAGQAMTGAQAAAQYGSEAQRMAEASRQFGAQQGLTSAQAAAQYGLAGQQATEQSRQYGARYGLDALQAQLQAAQTQGQLGYQQGQMGLQNLAAQLSAGTTQSAIEQQALDAQRKQFEQARAYPYEQLKFQQSLLSGLPISTQNAVGQTTGMEDMATLLQQIYGIGTATGAPGAK